MSTMNIIYGVHCTKYSNPIYWKIFLPNSIRSVRHFHPDANIYVLSYSEFPERFRLPSVSYISINNAEFSLPVAPWVRWIIPSMKALESIDKCLYMDADTLCLGSLEKLYSLNPKFLACHNIYRWDNLIRVPLVGAEDLPFKIVYSLSGLMLMNLSFLRRQNAPALANLFKETFEDKIRCNDENLIQYLSYVYEEPVMDISEYQFLLNRKTISFDKHPKCPIWHFAGADKGSIDRLKDYFLILSFLDSNYNSIQEYLQEIKAT